MNRKTLLLSASALLLALPVVAAPSLGFSEGNIIDVKAEAAAKIISIEGSGKCSNSASPNYFRILVPKETKYEATYSGTYFSTDGVSHSVEVKNQGTEQTEQKYHMLDVYVSPMIEKIILKSETIFTNNADSTDTFSFDKDYILTFNGDWALATISEYSGSTATVKTITAFDGNGKTINREDEDKKSNSSTGKKYRIYVTQSVTAYGDIYSGNVYDVSGKEYAVTLTNRGSSTLDGTGRHKFDVQFSEWTNHFIIKKDTRFVKSNDETILLAFDDDYFVTFEGEQAIPALSTKTAVAAETDQFVADCMHSEDISKEDAGTGACKGDTGYYSTAKTAYASLSNAAKILFQNDSAYADMKARYDAWAVANGDSGTKSGLQAIFGGSDSNYVIPTLAALALGVGASATILLFAKRKKKEK